MAHGSTKETVGVLKRLATSFQAAWQFVLLSCPLCIQRRLQGPFLPQIDINCVKEVHRVALGTPLRGVTRWLVTLSPGAKNNRRNQLLWESEWHSGEPVYRQAAAQPRPDTGLRQLNLSLSQRGPAEQRTCVSAGPRRERSAFITRSPYDTFNTMKSILNACLMDSIQTWSQDPEYVAWGSKVWCELS